MQAEAAVVRPASPPPIIITSELSNSFDIVWLCILKLIVKYCSPIENPDLRHDQSHLKNPRVFSNSF